MEGIYNGALLESQGFSENRINQSMVKRILRRIKCEIKKLRGPNNADIIFKIYNEKVCGSNQKHKFYSGSGFAIWKKEI